MQLVHLITAPLQPIQAASAALAASYACLSVRLSHSVTFVYCVETSKHIFTFFHRWVATPFKFFRTRRYGNHADETLPNWGKIAMFDQYLFLESMTSRVSSVVNNFDREVSL